MLKVSTSLQVISVNLARNYETGDGPSVTNPIGAVTPPPPVGLAGQPMGLLLALTYAS